MTLDCASIDLVYKNPNSLMFKKMELVLSKTKKARRVLDVGCGTGEFFLRAGNKFDELVGLDSNTDAINFAKKKLKGFKNIKLINKTIDSANLKENFFDCCIVLDVLEHNKDPVKILKSINCVLKKNGQLIVSVPNWYDIIFSRILKLNKEHKVAFFPWTWKRLIEEVGFRVDFIRSVEFPIIHLNFLAEKFYFFGKCIVFFATKV